MQTTIKKWGNSKAIRVSKDYAPGEVDFGTGV